MKLLNGTEDDIRIAHILINQNPQILELRSCQSSTMHKFVMNSKYRDIIYGKADWRNRLNYQIAEKIRENYLQKLIVDEFESCLIFSYTTNVYIINPKNDRQN